MYPCINIKHIKQSSANYKLCVRLNANVCPSNLSICIYKNNNAKAIFLSQQKSAPCLECRIESLILYIQERFWFHYIRTLA